jgi:hypothetical protein
VRDTTTHYPAARNLLWASLAGLVLTAGSAVFALNWPVAWLATGFLLGSALIGVVLGAIPGVEITASELVQKDRRIPWSSVYQVEKVMWTPLVVRLTLDTKTETLVFYAGNEASRSALLRDIRRLSRHAVIDGVPYREFWKGDAPRVERPSSKRQQRQARYPLLMADDEAEVERLFQQLKTAGHIEPKKSSDDK